MAADLLNLMLGTVVALLPIANPASTAALFLGITRGDSEQSKQRQARQGCIYMVAILLTFLVAGRLIMNFFGISIPGLRIAGGLMVARLGLGMLRPEQEATPDGARAEARRKEDISFTPLAMPSLSGPGAIAVTIGLASNIEGWLDYVAIAVGIGVVSVVCWLALRTASELVDFLGENGMNALGRIMGFLLLCVGVQFVVNGVIGVVLEEEVASALARAYRGALP